MQARARSSFRIRQLAAMGLPLAMATIPAHGYVFGDSQLNTDNALTLDGGTRLTTVDSGWYRSDFFHDPDNTNYAAGNCAHCALPPDNNHNNFFVFDISAVSAPVSALSFTVDTYVALETLHYSLHDYTGSVDVLRNGTGGAAAYTDLATGALYGEATIGPGNNYTLMGFQLSQAAVADFNQAVSTHQTYFVIGGTAPAVPEPDAPLMTLSGLAIAALAISSRRWSAPQATPRWRGAPDQ